MPTRRGRPAACWRSALTTGVDARPFVSPWNDARSSSVAPPSPPSSSLAWKTQRSPSATGAPLSASAPSSTSDSASPAGPASRRFATRMSEFWSRTASQSRGSSTSNRSARAGAARSAVTSAPLTSCRKRRSTSAYSGRCSTSIVRCALETTSASQMLILSSCHAPGESWLSRPTRIASKIARQSSCSGSEMASSASERAGYLERLIGESMAHGRRGAAAPDLALTSSGASKKKACHCANHASPSGIGTS
mmetsp:Transcript_26986/g.79244  ORF Transcript_26986/g.79244 Transcript_26986/m.79244 type:complete len:250 (+) Transcript_26986:750-1499(+)